MAKKKPTGNEIVFTIDAFTPETLPMARFAEYLSGIAALLGEKEHVHFVRVSKSSFKAHQKVEPRLMPVVRARLESVRSQMGAEDAMRGFREIDDLLRADEAIGSMSIGREKVLQFPGRKLAPAGSIGPIVQQDYVDGQLIRIGGKDETVPVHLREADGQIHYCTADVERARKLAPFLYGTELRVSGKGHWYREPDGSWRMHFFRIEDFEPLTDTTLVDAAHSIQQLHATDWPDNMLKELESLRSE